MRRLLPLLFLAALGCAHADLGVSVVDARRLGFRPTVEASTGVRLQPAKRFLVEARATYAPTSKAYGSGATYGGSIGGAVILPRNLFVGGGVSASGYDVRLANGGGWAKRAAGPYVQVGQLAPVEWALSYAPASGVDHVSSVGLSAAIPFRTRGRVIPSITLSSTHVTFDQGLGTHSAIQTSVGFRMRFRSGHSKAASR